MKVELVSLSGIKYADEAYEVVIPTAAGQIAVYPDHMPLVSLAVPGVLTVRKNATDSDDDVETYATYGGVVEIDGKTVRILVDEIEHADDLYEDEVREAFERAQELKANATSAMDIEKAQNYLEHQAARLKVSVIKQRRKHRT